MKRFKVTQKDWIHIGKTCGWIKEAKWGDIFGPKLSPAQQAYQQNKQRYEQQQLQQVAIVEEYVQRMASIKTAIDSITREIERYPAMLQYLANQPNGKQLVAQFASIDVAAQAIDQAHNTLYIAMQYVTQPWTQKQIDKVTAPTTRTSTPSVVPTEEDTMNIENLKKGSPLTYQSPTGKIIETTFQQILPNGKIQVKMPQGGLFAVDLDDLIANI